MVGTRDASGCVVPVVGSRVSEVRKIAVLRCNGLGDLVFALPALDALRAAYPEAEIVLLASPWHRDFFEKRPRPVDRVVVVPPMPRIREDGVPDEETIVAFFDAMAAERFDLAIQLHGGGRDSNPFVLRLGARTTVGLKAPDAPPLDLWVPYVYFQNEIFRYLEVVALVGARPTLLEPRVAVTDDDLDEALAVVPDTDRPLVALHPGATDGRRRWPPASFAHVGDALVCAGARVVVTGTATDGSMPREVAGTMTLPVQDVSGRLSIGGLAGLLCRCAVVVSNDSGPLHLAAAVGAATVGIFWCGNLINGGYPWLARHRPLVSWRLDCPECGTNCIRGRCDHRLSFVTDVPVQEVTHEALDLLRAATRGHGV